MTEMNKMIVVVRRIMIVVVTRISTTIMTTRTLRTIPGGSDEAKSPERFLLKEIVMMVVM